GATRTSQSRRLRWPSGWAGPSARERCARFLAPRGWTASTRPGSVAWSDPGVIFSALPASGVGTMPRPFKEKPMTRALAVALCLAAVPALAFEGVIETKMTMNRSAAHDPTAGTGPSTVSGSGLITVKGLNSRMEQQMAIPGMGGGKTIVIHRADDPNTTYILNDGSKTYSKHTIEKNDESEGTKWTVKKLGKDTVAGRSTEHVQV